MKKNKTLKIFILLMVGIFVSCIFNNSTSKNYIMQRKILSAPANTNFTDQNFYNCVVDAYNEENNLSYSYDAMLTTQRLRSIKKLECNNKSITNVDGIDLLTGLTELTLKNNKIEKIDLTNNTNLVSVNVSENSLTELKVAGLTKLKDLYAEKNKLKTITLAGNLALDRVELNDNVLTGLIAESVTTIRFLEVDNNKLTSSTLNSIIAKNKKLQLLNAKNNSLTSLDVSNNPELTSLNVSNNSISTLDVSKNTKLAGLTANNNNLSKLDVSKNTQLTGLRVANNKLTTLDVSKNTKLNILYVYSNAFTKNIGVYVGGSINVSNGSYWLKLFTGKSSTFKSVSSTTSLEGNPSLGIVKFSKSGKYTVNATYNHNVDSGPNTNSYTGTYTVYVIQATSDKYYINDSANWIYIGTDSSSNVSSNVKVNYGTKSVSSGKLQLAFNGSTIKTFTIKSLTLKNLSLSGKNISLASSMTYQNFISKITLSSGLSYKIYNGTKQVTSGNIANGMVLKIYSGSTEIDSYKIAVKSTTEYLNMSSLDVNESKKLIKNLSLKTSVSSFKGKISTNGTITLFNPSNKQITGSSYITTGSKVKIALSSKTHEYILSVKGDVTGSGTSTVSDVAKLYQYLKGKIKMDDCYIEAGNVVSTDNEIKVNDVAKLYQFIKGKISSL